MSHSGQHSLLVAFSHMPDGMWTGGIQYLRNLFAALHCLEDDLRPEIALLVQPQTEPESYGSLISYIDQVLHRPPDPPRPRFTERQWMRVQKLLGTWREPEPLLSCYLREHQVAALFGISAAFGPRFDTPLLSWIPDFQHLHLPEMFTDDEISGRNERFSDIVRYADRVILSSQNARRDFEQFAPQAASKARVLSFVAQVPADVYDNDPAWVCQQYHLPERFFFLPNQFWKHKNHEVVLQALALLQDRHPEITVVCTGNTNDYRNPLFFSKFMAQVSSSGLRDNLIILGMIPHAHLFSLMRQSLAVLQPSLFEGWSTTVEEVKSLGKRMVISDIPVHREQNPPRSVFFDPYAASSLADCLVQIYDEAAPGPDHDLEAQTQEQLPTRARQFSGTFVSIIQEVQR